MIKRLRDMCKKKVKEFLSSQSNQDEEEKIKRLKTRKKFRTKGCKKVTERELLKQDKEVEKERP